MVPPGAIDRVGKHKTGTSMTDKAVQLTEILSWRLVTELWRRFPDRFYLIETHPGGGQYDCLSLVTINGSLTSVLGVNRGGSVHVHKGKAPQSWSDWTDRMLDRPQKFLDQICQAMGMTVPKKLPKTTATTVAFRYITDFLPHAIGQLEQWECRNGFLDTSGYDGGKRENWFNRFPSITPGKMSEQLAHGKLDPAYGYWFLLRDGEPMLCIDLNGRLHKPNGEAYDLLSIYSKHRRIWPVIAETAIELLP